MRILMHNVTPVTVPVALTKHTHYSRVKKALAS
jgi:hypothetical protein